MEKLELSDYQKAYDKDGNEIDASSIDINDGTWTPSDNHISTFQFTKADFYTEKLRWAWFLYGRKKLPRKMKKRVFLTKKLREQYLPRYYSYTKQDLIKLDLIKCEPLVYAPKMMIKLVGNLTDHR